MIVCAECGHPLAVIMRELSGHKKTLYFVCRTYQRFTQERKCTCHCVRVDTVTEAVMSYVREVCESYLDKSQCDEIVAAEVAQADMLSNRKQEIDATSKRIEDLSRKIDKVYDDRLSGVIAEDDFTRMYRKLKDERAQLEEQKKEMERSKRKRVTKSTEELMQKFINSVEYNRELLVSILDKVELKDNKDVIIHFKIPIPERVAHCG